jgi:hypothetical protein
MTLTRFNEVRDGDRVVDALRKGDGQGRVSSKATHRAIGSAPG